MQPIDSTFKEHLRKGFFLYLFYGLMLCLTINLRVDFSLHDLNYGTGEPALRNFDPALRARMFYISALLLISLILFFAWIQRKIFFWLTDHWLSILNYTSLGALFVLYSHIQQPCLFSDLKKIYDLQGLFSNFSSITFFFIIHLLVFIYIFFSNYLSRFSFFSNIKPTITSFPPFSPSPLLPFSFSRISHRIILYVFVPAFFCILLYQPLCLDLNNLFELGNPVLSIQQFFEFEKIPLLQSFNSHLLSEIVPGFIYSWFHGYTGDLSFLHYDYLIIAVSQILGFYTIYLITGNFWIPVLVFIFLPVGGFLFPPMFSLAPLPILLFVLAIRKNNSFTFFLWTLSVFFNLIWRIDIGISSLLASAGVTLFYYHKNYKSVFRNILISLEIILASILLLLIGISIIKGINLLEPLQSIYEHFSGATIYGTKALSIEYDALFFTHYIIFPILVLVILCWLLLYRKNFLHSEDNQRTLITIILFYFCVYYLTNFHRGLIRHSFAEQDDLHVSTFIFLILPTSIYLFLPPVINKTKLNLLFLLSVVLLCFQFKHPVEKNNNIQIPFDTFIKRITGQTFAYSRIINKNGNYVIPANFLDKKFSDLKLFSDKFLKENETFLDFSNSPMLYFYCHKRNPSYFNQVPNQLSTKKLQKKFLNSIKNENVPYLIFSRNFESGYDAQDEVPNTVRANHIAAYLFQNYIPSFIINDYRVWIGKNYISRIDSIFIPTSSLIPDTFSLKPESYNLRYIPYTLGKLDLDFIDKKFKPIITLKVTLPNNLNENEYSWSVSKYDSLTMTEFLWLSLQNQGEEDIEAVLSYETNTDSSGLLKSFGQFRFIVSSNNDNHHYIIPLNSQYAWIKNKIDVLRLNTTKRNVKVMRAVLCKWK